ncbi:hypothetical protein HNQ07_000781 [Deinococcus metalli]|uniref:Uncharacterized protein n=1 Tax=Deinococcus metalli TaxID=1141878 RepID=A0A7W8NQQ7_9DEIO|nr:hypothetical protein [Deinococcus metalli]MBB5375337.1 hypothetical protein [Deinococcus metalli]GHF30021.1 hypothetical protein GCM10017781_02590 [Deinococcus metalli]
MTASAERPTRPLVSKPAGYVELARYSSLGRLWAMLGGAVRAGRTVSLVRGDSAEVCRRRIAGAALPNAAVFLDTARVLSELEDAFTPHPALVALLAGDAEPLRAEVNAHFELRLDFVLALTARRDLVMRPEFRFVPIVRGLSDLPDDLPLDARRLGRDELHLLVQRACGLA